MIAIDRGFSHYTGISIIAHIVVLLLAIGINHIKYISKEKMRRENVILLSSSVKVDVVAMPKLTVKELKAAGADISMRDSREIVAKGVAEEEALSKKSADSESTILKVKKKLDIKKLLNKYTKSNSAKKVKRKKKSTGSNKKVTPSNSEQRDIKQLILAGNKLSKGNSITGGDSEASTGEFAEYLGSFPDWIRPHWKLPGYLADKGLKCRIRVFISSTGEVVKTEIFETSGDDEYDNRALNAINNSSPFPPPPSGLRARVIRGDIVLGFPL